LKTGATRIRCSYCGARLVFEAGRTEEAQPPIAKAWRPTLLLAVALVACVVVIDLVLGFANLWRPNAPVAEAVPPSQPALRDHLADLGPQARTTAAKPGAAKAAAGLLLFDANGDGVEDVVGVFESEDAPKERWWLGVVSGTDGAPLWRVPGADAPSGLDATLRALVGDALVVVEDTGSAQCFDLRSGRRKWTHALPPAVNDVCAGSHDVGFRAADGALMRLDLASGVPAAPPPSDACARAYTTNSRGRDFSVVHGDEARDLAGAASANMTVDRALVSTVGGARVLLGTERSNGVEAVASVADGRLIWLAPVGAPLSRASKVAGSTAALAPDRVVVAYVEKGTMSPRFTCFDRATGRRAWDIDLHQNSDDFAEMTVSGDGQVFVRLAKGSLVVLDLQTGARRDLGSK
jgi:outer membrane protein assembly factor BamB